ncbi:ABC transporter permease [Dactylosporangium aurantiacum]|uniref:ABC transporter permease n=1 Tax=Dactylosporangium aurantiacum TaxID=35754 RepID=A0A9Q9ISD0_9ACTN|nr:ABC transporter permease subunit [Dactylosporangium aurantiacum]MDG6103722.1 ABC transporter permease subunit [Dactylosporangium aurantiacum]UWZ59060.1 ABC transporter permease [Dactylosporangium aurantiacum]
MIWLTWRQLRAQSVAAAAALTLLALYLIHLGRGIRAFHDTRIAGCAGDACRLARMQLRGDYGDTVALLGLLLLVVPALIGVFWGAPLVARELEERTDRLVWNQSVTRTRWLAVKLTVVGLCSALVTGAFSLLLTWSAGPYDAVTGERFAAVNFAARDVVPVGYGVFAFVLGAVAGMLVRRTLPAMAVTLVVFTALQVLVPAVVRQHLMPPVTETVAMDTTVLRGDIGLSLEDDGTFTIRGYTVPGGWALRDSSPVVKSDGSAYTGDDAKPCVADIGDMDATIACTAAQRLRFEHTYQPAGRYWTFQWIELSLYLLLSLLLAGFGLGWLRRRV